MKSRMKSQISKHKEIVAWINEKVQSNDLKIGDRVPSFTQIRKLFSVSRDTAVKAYNELKSKDIITSIHGKGFFIKAAPQFKHKVFLLFDEFTPYKQILFNSIHKTFGKNSFIDIYFHHFNQKLFKNLVEEAAGHYSSYIIIPMIYKGVEKELEKLPGNKLYLLDIGLKQFGKTYPCVCQNFEKDIANALSSAITRISGYSSLKMIVEHPVDSTCADITGDIIRGFKVFCKKNKLNSAIIYSAKSLKPEKNTCYIVHYDTRLVELIEKANEMNLKIGKDIGLISFNDTPLKRVVNKGITTISTDFRKMGEEIANMVINQKREKIENPFNYIERKSL